MAVVLTSQTSGSAESAVTKKDFFGSLRFFAAEWPAFLFRRRLASDIDVTRELRLQAGVRQKEAFQATTRRLHETAAISVFFKLV